MKKYNLYVGLNDKDSKRQEISTLDAYKVMMNYFDGATITEATGFYKHDDGTLIIEKSLKVEILDFNDDFNLKASVADLKKLFNQESIAVQIEEVNSQLM